MCGRYITIKKIQEIERRFGVIAGSIKQLLSNVNVSVGDFAPVVASNKPTELQLFQFGLTPFWAKKKMYVFNARSEGDFNKENDPTYTGAKGILQKPMFRKPIRSQRCLVIADAVIEGSKEKRLNEPFLIYPSDSKESFAMAGIWDEWVNKETGELSHSFSIITTTANDLLQKVGHHRSPVILDRGDEKAWLDPTTDISDITALLRHFPPHSFNAYPISNAIKSPKANDPTLLAPLGKPIYQEYDYIIYDELELLGMGESPARQRRKDEDRD